MGNVGQSNYAAAKASVGFYLPTVQWLGLRENLQGTGWFSERVKWLPLSQFKELFDVATRYDYIIEFERLRALF